MKTIKNLPLKTLICFLMCLIALKTEAQNPYIIIGDTTSPGLERVNLNDKKVQITGNGWIYNPIDIDKNGINDLTVELHFHVGSGSFDHYIRLTSKDQLLFSTGTGTMFIVNTNKTPNDTTTKPVPIVKIYPPQDTLYAGDCKDSLSNFDTYDKPAPGSIYSYMHEWISGIHYFGMKKVINNTNYLGWFKINVIDEYTVILMEYAIQQLPVGIKETHESTASIYPNPTQDVLNISGVMCKDVEIYNALGKVVLAEKNKNNSSSFSINIQQLEPGMYFTKITEQGKEGYGVKKFIKE